MKNQFRINNPPATNSIQEACSKLFVDNNHNDPSILKNNARVDFNDKNLDVRFPKINSFPTTPEHLAAQYYVDQATSINLDELSLL